MSNYDFDPPGHDNWTANSIGNQHGSLRLPNMDYKLDNPKELIDFPCADNWLRYYFLRGQTPRRPIAYPQPQSTPDATESLREGFQSIGDAIREIQIPKPFVDYSQEPEQQLLPPPAPTTTKGVALE